jgi:hypothetical protein
MNTIHTTLRLTTIDRWLAPHAAAMIAFAETDSLFALTLASIINDESWDIVAGPAVPTSTHLLPADHVDAEDILDWLLYELATHPEARVSRSLLTVWADDYEFPTGIGHDASGISLVKPTLGLITKSRRKSELQIVANKNWKQSISAETLCEISHSLSQDLIALELRKAGGKIGSLHPDTAEWTMGGARTKLYDASPSNLNNLHKIAVEEKLHHLTFAHNKQIVALAVSPAVCDGFVVDRL